MNMWSARVLLLPCILATALGAPDWSNLNRCIVKVVAQKGLNPETGTGIVISASSSSIRILTAGHVVAGASNWIVYFGSDRNAPYTAKLLDNGSGSLDLAVLEVRQQDRPLPTSVPPLATGTARDDQRVWTVDGNWIHIPNTVVLLDHDTDTRRFEYTKVAVDDGFSGGPVFDDDGRLVGIHDGAAPGGRYAVAAKIESVIATLTSPSLGYDVPNLRGPSTARDTAASSPSLPNPAGPRLGSNTRVNPIDGLTYVWIPPGAFTMGCSPGDNQCFDDEKPARAAQIRTGFWLGQTEVTQAAWQKMGGSVGSDFEGDRLPIENVDWNQATDYCKRIGGRLPSEQEWEYAARAGSSTARYGPLDAIEWYVGNSGGAPHQVGLKQANAFGLYDMLGNVAEWTSSEWTPRADDSLAYEKIGNKVIRGGSWDLPARYVRASRRVWQEPTSKPNYLGFRCAGDWK